MRDLVAGLQLKAGQVFMTLRVAITGSRISPGLFETMVVLGKDRVIGRIEHALAEVESVGSEKGREEIQ
jgi:glutamyl-tRNA synthetase